MQLEVNLARTAEEKAERMKNEDYLQFIQSEEAEELAQGMKAMIEQCNIYMKGNNKVVSPLDAFMLQLTTRQAIWEREEDLAELQE